MLYGDDPPTTNLHPLLLSGTQLWSLFAVGYTKRSSQPIIETQHIAAVGKRFWYVRNKYMQQYLPFATICFVILQCQTESLQHVLFFPHMFCYECTSYLSPKRRLTLGEGEAMLPDTAVLLVPILSMKHQQCFTT